MNLLSRIKLRTKLTVLVALSTAALLASVGAAAIIMHQRMVDDRVDKLRAVVQSAIGLARSLETQVASHRLTKEAAVAQLREDIHAMRFDGGSGYITVQVEAPNGQAIILAHGSDPSREDKPTTAKDGNGRPISEMIAEVLTGHDNGVISYTFPKPGESVPLVKFSFVARFDPWKAAFYAGAYVDDLEAAFSAAMSRLAMIGGGILCLTLLVAFFVNRDITRSLGALKAAMHRLSRDELTADVPGTERRDEVGEMAGTVLVFKDSLLAASRLREAQATARSDAETAKREALTAMAGKIEADTEHAVLQISGRTKTMTTTAEAMRGLAARVGVSAGGADKAAVFALTNAETAASAAEELSASIGEISNQVNHSTASVSNAVEASNATRSAIDTLTERVARIGAVAEIIRDIAAKTNLLYRNTCYA